MQRGRIRPLFAISVTVRLMSRPRSTIYKAVIRAFKRTLLACGWAAIFPFLVASALARPAGSPPVPELPPLGEAVFRQTTMIGWSENEAPSAPPGFVVQKFADNLDHPRWLLVLPNGDTLVAQARTEKLGGMSADVIAALTRQGVLGASPNNIILIRASETAPTQTEFLAGLSQPFGMALLDNYLYVANTDSLVRYRYPDGAARIDSVPEKLLDIPAGEQTNNWNNHWTRNVVVRPDGRKLYLSVGAATNVNAKGIDHPERAAIWELNPDGSGKRLHATGLRNPVGMDFDPLTGDLWTTVNERDGLGEDVPPDFLTRVVNGEFYGWPYVYFGTYPDPTHSELNPHKVAESQETARVPDLALGAHSVPLGLLFYEGSQFPERYRNGAFVARRGGVARAELLGFDVIFVPFENGSPKGEVEAFLTGFIEDPDKGTVHGRPVGLAMLPDGSLLVTDDTAHVIWRVSYSTTD
jgi:glucose/arabinose dehydrogenase